MFHSGYPELDKSSVIKYRCPIDKLSNVPSPGTFFCGSIILLILPIVDAGNVSVSRLKIN
jgi:hypothetical protein